MRRCEKVLMSGFPGSGNYLLWTMIREIQLMRGAYRSFKRESGLSDVYEKVVPEEHRKMHDEREFDAVFGADIELHDKRLRRIKVDIELLESVSSIIWSNISPPKDGLWERHGRVPISIHRDSTMTITSLLHKVIRPLAIAIQDDYKWTTIDEVVHGILESGEGYVERLSRRWARHLHERNSQKREWNGFRYEEIAGDQKRSQIVRLSEILGASLNDDEVDRVMDVSSFSKMKKHSPRHCRSGRVLPSDPLGIRDRVEAAVEDELHNLERGSVVLGCQEVGLA
jgi:hypothetical protein